MTGTRAKTNDDTRLKHRPVHVAGKHTAAGQKRIATERSPATGAKRAETRPKPPAKPAVRTQRGTPAAPARATIEARERALERAHGTGKIKAKIAASSASTYANTPRAPYVPPVKARGQATVTARGVAKAPVTKLPAMPLAKLGTYSPALPPARSKSKRKKGEKTAPKPIRRPSFSDDIVSVRKLPRRRSI